jgi:hypothetical protein
MFAGVSTFSRVRGASGLQVHVRQAPLSAQGRRWWQQVTGAETVERDQGVGARHPHRVCCTTCARSGTHFMIWDKSHAAKQSLRHPKQQKVRLASASFATFPKPSCHMFISLVSDTAGSWCLPYRGMFLLWEG